MIAGPLHVEPVAPGRRADGPVLPIRQRLWSIPASILAAGAMIALALLFGHRYEAHPNQNVLWRLDRLTGEITSCAYGINLSDAGRRWCDRYPATK